MIHRTEFFFLRHGQTDHNLSELGLESRKPIKDPEVVHDIPLNTTGRKQAQEIEAVIAALPIKSICFSPLKRAKETKEIVSSKLQANHHEIPELMECSMTIWDAMTQQGTDANEYVQAFVQRVRNGINQALSQEGPVLIVAHGGVHWALCSLMGVDDHHWSIGNCIPVHFSLDQNGLWRAKKLL